MLRLGNDNMIIFTDQIRKPILIKINFLTKLNIGYYFTHNHINQHRHQNAVLFINTLRFLFF